MCASKGYFCQEFAVEQFVILSKLKLLCLTPNKLTNTFFHFFLAKVCLNAALFHTSRIYTCLCQTMCGMRLFPPLRLIFLISCLSLSLSFCIVVVIEFQNVSF